MSLRCRNLQAHRRERILFSNLELALDPGEVLRITGDNGSGKTTLLKILAGLRPPDRGHVLWQDEDIGSSGTGYRGQLLYIGHAAGIKDCFTAWENLVHGELQDGPHAKAAALEALSRAGLEAQAMQRAQAMSQGQRRRVALARLYLPLRPPLWILDEPFVGLDASSTEALSATMQAHREAGGIIVYSTHQEAGPPGVRQLGMGGAPGC